LRPIKKEKNIMSLRFNAINNLSSAQELQVENPTRITAIFGESVFTVKTAREFLSDEAYKSLVGSIRAGQKIDRAMANQIASGIRSWAEARGVTHFYSLVSAINRNHC
jgi:glutamine synthetase